MRSAIYFVCIACILVLFFACTSKKSFKYGVPDFEVVEVNYAQGFTIHKYVGYTVITVRHPQDTSEILGTYFLVNMHDSVPVRLQNENIIRTPIEKIACISTTHLGFLNALELRNKIVGFSGVEYVYDSILQKLIMDESIREIGFEGALNLELLVSLNPDLLMTYLYDDPKYSGFDKMDALQLNSVLNNEYLETTPLGQAEWIKFVAAFFESDALADSIFQNIEQDYNQVKELTKNIAYKPTVFTGLPFKGEWTVPGGNSFAARYLADAGAEYLWKTNSSTGNIPVAFEEVIQKAVDADIWLHAGAKMNLEQIAETDSRLKNFNAWQSGEVYNNNNRLNKSGGNDYWESAVVNPQIVLRDLVSIMHPQLLSEHKLVYYKKLQP